MDGDPNHGSTRAEGERFPADRRLAGDDDPAIRALELPLIYFFCFLAASSLILMLALRYSIAFSTTSILIVAALGIAILPLLLLCREIWPRDRCACTFGRYSVAAIGLSLLGGLLTASINRPDVDDSIYAPKAVFYTEHAAAPLDYSINWIAGLPGNPPSIVFQYFETTQAALAYRFGAHFLTFYHIVFPFIAGFLMCISVFLLLSLFEPRRWAALAGLLLFILVALCLGETHRSFGNISIARTFHAKYMFMAVGIPAWTYFSLRFFEKRNLTTLFVLAVLGVGAGNATTTAFVVLPLLSVLLLASYTIGTGRVLDRDIPSITVGYVAALIPVVGLALHFRSAAGPAIGSGSAFNIGFPLTFEGQLNFLINPKYPLTLLLFLGSTAAALYYTKHRRFLFCWIAMAICLYLNPVVSDYLIKYVTTENIYWRLFYLLPFPLTVVLAFLGALKNSPLSKAICGAMIAATLYPALWGPTTVLRDDNGAKLEWPGYKIERNVLSAVKEISSSTKAGTMFAPIEIASNLLIYTSSFPQFYMRADYLEYAVVRASGREDFVSRLQLGEYLYGQGNPTGLPLLEKWLLSSARPKSIVLPTAVSGKQEIDQALSANRYRKRPLSGGDYVMYESIHD